MRIGFATSDWSRTYKSPDGSPAWGGAGWYRCGLPGKYLAQRGHDVVFGTLVEQRSTSRLGVRTHPDADDWEEGEVYLDLDVIVVQRYMHEPLIEDVAKAVANGQVVLQDLDDWLWGMDPRHHGWRTSHPKVRPDENREHYRRIIAASSGTLCSTPYLAERIASWGSGPKVVVPNAIELSAFESAWEDREDIRGWPDDPTVGWTGAVPFRNGDLEQLRGTLGPWMKRHDLAFHHSGWMRHADAGEALGLDPSTEVTTLPLSPIEEVPDLYRPIDLGVIPLRSCSFNDAKSAIKGMEMAAAGVPFVAAASPAYYELRDAYVIGRVARKPKDWMRHLDELLDPEVRRREARRNRVAVEALDIEHRVTAWEEAFERFLP